MADMDHSLLAPCGILCTLCVAYQGYTMKGTQRKHKCTGCRDYNKNCAFLKRDCEKLKENLVDYCIECIDFPCENLMRIDKRYREKYETSLIENLCEIQKIGATQFIEKQLERYKCPNCRETICMHTVKCYNCGYQLQS
ncbi:DUF3795 domain-containing protein [Candidatus Bathyarchaeota archaeon]|nr:DUF3795 domain-containing protein [Candidatus Bathyarchaeota archaeon]